MGKYQSVVTPKFYIDYFQYVLTTGLIGVGDISNNFGADNNELKKLFYLNPTNTVSIINAEANNIAINTKLTSLEEHNFDYAMILNHNGQAVESSFVLSLEALAYDTVSIVDDFSIPSYNGWTAQNITPDEDVTSVDELMITIYNTIGITNIGSISVGTIYEMPHSPDLDLTMTREFGGASKKWTISGRLLTNYNYTHPPLWGDGEAWGLYTDVPTNLGARRAGRRTWDLKFSYLSASDIMANMEMINLNAEEDTTDYNNSLSDNTFFSQFMQKTLGGSLRFIFQPDGEDYNPDGFAICVLDQDLISIKQSAHNTYDISLKIMEVW